MSVSSLLPFISNDQIFILAFFLAVTPALFWLWFWLREDSEHPEPWPLIAISFLSGMAVIPLVIPLQQLAQEMHAGSELILAWVIIEEAAKYLVALLVVLWNSAVDEPLDMVMYMIFVALGFAAFENALYAYQPLTMGAFQETLISGSMRFVGATLLHVLASASVGVFMAYAFYKSSTVKLLYGLLGLLVSIILHAAFNFAIMFGGGDAVLLTFLFVWLGVIVLFIVLEKVKKITPRNS